MKKIILNFPKQFKVGLKSAGNIKIRVKKGLKGVCVCGMRGSALPGNLLFGIIFPS